MRPIHLSIDAFGAFAGHVEIDFDALAPRGLFLVAGETGTGKTTIFDAICWALYGEMPLKETNEVRSDHVEPDTRCEVVFTFESGGIRYRVQRNPEQLRPPKRGSGRSVKELSAVSLFRLEGSGKELIAGKAADVKAHVEAIIGLDAAQFQRVILLPQGEFTQFLLASSDDRERTLTKLFGGAIYKRITDELKEMRDRASAELGTVDLRSASALDQARRHLADAALALGQPDDGRALDDSGTGSSEPADASNAGGAPDGDTSDRASSVISDESSRVAEAAQLRATSTALLAAAAACRAEADDAAAKVTASAAHHERSKATAQRFDRAAELRVVIDELDEATKSVDAARVAAEASRSARPVVTAADRLSQARTAEASALQARDDRSATIIAALDALGIESITAPDTRSPVELHQHLAEGRATHLAQKILLGDVIKTTSRLATLQSARVILDADLATAQADKEDATAQIQKLEPMVAAASAIAATSTEVESALVAAETAVTNHTELTRARAEASNAAKGHIAASDDYQHRLAEFVDTQASRLATTLVEGAPCPVCGAVEHPSPAGDGSTEPVSWEQVDAAHAQLTVTEQHHRVCQDRLTVALGKLGDDADTDPDVLSQRVDDLRSRRTEVLEATETLRTTRSQLDRVTASLAELEVSIGILGERRTKSDRDLADAETDAKAATSAAKGIDADRLEATETDLDRLGAALEGYADLVSEVAHHQTTVGERDRELVDALHASPYGDLDTARAGLIDEAAERQAISTAKDHEQRLTKARTELTTLTDEGIPTERPDLEHTEAMLVAAEERAKTLAAQATGASTNLDHAQRALDDHDALAASEADLRIQAELTALAYAVCHGDGSRLRVPLKRWILAHELDRITLAANVHLAQMTDHRYTLTRRTGEHDSRRTYGLDLEVLDAHTGRPRSTSSLSGGEQFQASLALALGLADVISHGGTAGGQVFEALFVDEGFGSLSANALDDAIDTLNRLQSAGRMVGAITHVEAMKEALHVGIEVTRRTDGKGSDLRVNV